MSVELECPALTTETSLTIVGEERELPPGEDGGVAMKLEGAALRLGTVSRFLVNEGGRSLGEGHCGAVKVKYAELKSGKAGGPVGEEQG